NVQRYLRTPVVALTVKTLRSKPAPPSVVDEEKKSTLSPNNKNNNNSSCGDWREYLQDDSNDTSNRGTTTTTTIDKKVLRQQYTSLSRRTKARMEAFLAGCSLAVPGPDEEDSKVVRRMNETEDVAMMKSLSLQDGLSGFGLGQSVRDDIHNSNGNNHSHTTPYNNNGSTTTTTRHRPTTLTEKMGRAAMGQITDPHLALHPQMEQDDLVVRLELYLRTVQRVSNLKEECVIAMEPPKAIKVRAKCTTYAFVATAAYVRNISPVLTRLLHCLTMEMLAVECVAEDITKVIHRIVSEYEHGTSFASLAFLSTPEVNADSLLMPLILKYLKYLQSDWERLVQQCSLERMFARAIDPTVRKMFKTIEFQSIGHLLEVCHQFRDQLQSIELAPNVCAMAENINTLCNSPDAIRQALRDLRREVITVNGHVLPPVTSRKELINLLTQTLNSRTLTSPMPKKKKSRGRKKGARRQQAAAAAAAYDDSEFSSEVPSSPERHTTTMLPPHFGSSGATDGIIGDLSEGGFDSSTVETPPNGDRKQAAARRRRSKFHLSTIDVLTRRLLIAASRTGNGGDAYFFVKDLFGGEDIEVVPTSTIAFQDRMVRPGTIDILVRLASVTIKCHQSFDIYPKSLVGEVEPLIQFHATTTESISLQEVRAEDSIEGKATPDDRSENGGGNGQAAEASSSLMVVQEQRTDRTGYRVISIRPAMYEKIETWNTPS
ncbi:MAG: hypothetical protein SGILL_009618, partial [Bacillariaceae sp.]